MGDERYVVALREARELSRAGGKALKLGELLRAGLPVPEGFVVEAGEGSWEEEVRGAYRGMGGGAVAVRSSGVLEDGEVMSMAGQFETFLGVMGEEGVVEAVRKCRASAGNERVRAYLRERGMGVDGVSMGVVVQRMVEAEVAGVMFTENPEESPKPESRNPKLEVVIEASWGLGDMVVSGLVEPDRIVMEKGTGRVISESVGSKEKWRVGGKVEGVPAEKRGVRCVSDGNLRELWEMAKRVEELFGGSGGGAGQDVEWAIAGGRLWLLQARAITARGGRGEAAARMRDEAVARVRAEYASLLSQGRSNWVRHNLGETVPHPTALTWSVLRRFMTGEGGFGRMLRQAGYSPGPLVAREGCLELIGGRIYMDVRRGSEMFADDFGFRYDVELLKQIPSAVQNGPTRTKGGFRTRMAANRVVARAKRRLSEWSVNLDRRLDEEEFPRFREWAAKEIARDLTTLDAEAWVTLWEHRERRVMEEIAPWTLLPGLVYGWALGRLRDLIAEHFWEEDAEATANLLAMCEGGDATIRANDELYRVGRGEMALETWLKENGHRGPGEFDLGEARWREKPEAVRSMARRLAQGVDPADARRERFPEAQGKLREMMVKLPRREAARLEEYAGVARRYVRFREDGKHELMRGYGLLRDLVLEASRRLGASAEDLALLRWEELAAAMRGGEMWRQEQARHNAQRKGEELLVLPEVITEKEAATLGEEQATGGEPPRGERLAAVGLSRGTGRGRVWVVRSAAEILREMGPGYVLVCPSADPSWTPLFANAAGIVLERGGMLSHAAVVAREMGKPVVVLKDATRVLRDGEGVTVDGTGGAVVRVVEGGNDLEAARRRGEDPDDVRVSPEKVPPAEGRMERIGGRVRDVFLVIWGVYLLLVWLAPGLGLREQAMKVFDVLLWPVVRSYGRIGGVMVLAAGMALVSMLGQWAWTDVKRLREAKRRAAALQKEADALPLESARFGALTDLILPVHWRIARAGFVPLAVLLGPMMMAFLWLPERIDPANVNPVAGTKVMVMAVVDGEYVGEVHLRAGSGAVIEDHGDGVESEQDSPPMRETLTALAGELAGSSELSPVVQNRLAATGRSREELLKDLRAFLGSHLPAQYVSWTVRTPAGAPGVYSVMAQVAGEPPVVGTIATGDAAPPPLKAEVEGRGRVVRVAAGDAGEKRNGSRALEEMRIFYPDERRAEERVFLRPFAWAGWNWDAGWLSVYMAVYIVAMAVTRRGLRIP